MTIRFLTAFGMTLCRFIQGVEKAAAKPLLFPLPPPPANARHFDRREKSPQKYVIGTEGMNLLKKKRHR